MSDVTTTGVGFETLPLSAPVLANLAQLEYRTMTPIQALALPTMLEGKDVLGQAGTGTGKTAAFGLAVLARTTPLCGRPGALILCPTRELAAQVADELRRLARPMAHTKVITLSGGTAVHREAASLAHGVDIIVGTPGRVQDHLARGRLDLGAIRTLVLDEADRMLEMGFVEVVREIVAATPTWRQTLLFSATFPEAVRAMSASLQREAVHVAAPVDDAAARVTQLLYDTGGDRVAALRAVLGHHRPASAVIFCNQRETCDVVAKALADAGLSAIALHGGMDQHDRNTVLLLLKNGSARLVIATDVAARGLDIDDLGAVINYELPRDLDTFVHRIGRTARAGRHGLAVSLVEDRDRHALATLRGGPLGETAVSPLPPPSAEPLPPPPNVTLAIQAGRHERLRPGDILGALTNEVGLAAADIGQITILDRISFVAIAAAQGPKALAGINAGRIKNQRFRAYEVIAPGAEGPRAPR
ncbi:MAG: ATP-dependent RNA helicase DbpA [Deltaproteobacteria bacterium]|nr:ATP-dependent RNA helicase DbpA [Deltaproteobacteria bacterium]